MWALVCGVCACVLGRSCGEEREAAGVDGVGDGSGVSANRVIWNTLLELSLREDIALAELEAEPEKGTAHAMSYHAILCRIQLQCLCRSRQKRAIEHVGRLGLGWVGGWVCVCGGGGGTWGRTVLANGRHGACWRCSVCGGRGTMGEVLEFLFTGRRVLAAPPLTPHPSPSILAHF